MAVGVADARVPVIRTQGLSKIYSAGTEAEVAALRGVDLVIDRGEFVAIMGPSGSGKSTLMNLIGCLDTPTSGKYFCDGVDVATLDAEELAVLRRDKIGFVFQGFNLLPRMSALENVAMPMGYANVPRPQRLQRAHEAMAAVGLQPAFIGAKQNPIPWINTWLSSDNVQVAPQEVEVSSYLVGQIDSEVHADDLGDFEL